MKDLVKFGRRCAVMLACGSAALLAVGSVQAQSAVKKGTPPAPVAVKEIRLTHQFDAARAEALEQLVTRFNEGQRGYRLIPQEAKWDEREAPHLMVLQGDEMERFLAGKARYKPLAAMMREAGVPLQTARPPATLPRAMLDAKGSLVALPVGLSTPILYLNRGVFQRAGLNPDTPMSTWSDLQQALGQLFDAGSVCPYTVSEPGRTMIENTSAWHNEPLMARRGGPKEMPSFNGMLQVKHVAMMASWHRSKYLRTFRGEAEAERGFVSGDCAVIAAPSASWTDFRRKAGFEVGVAPLPYHEDFPGAPQNTLADGPALWVAAGKSRSDYKVIARFVAFWLQPENQVAWQRESGYLPLNRAGLMAAQSDLLGDDLANVRVAVSQLNHKPATAESGASSMAGQTRMRAILDEELEAVWDDRKPAKEALDTAVLRTQQSQVPAKK